MSPGADTTLKDQRPADSAAAHLGAMLDWLHQLLAWQITLTRQVYGALADDEYRGLYIPNAEIDILSAGLPALPHDLHTRRIELMAERERLEAWARTLEEQGIDLPLRRVARTFGLSSFECDVLLMALASELDLRYERLYAYIQDDVTKKRPSVDLALRLLCAEPGERHSARAAFAADAPLLHHRLIQLFEDGQRQPPLLARSIKLDDRMVAEVLGQHAPDPLITSFGTLV